jgi:hypothetical protein
MKSYSTIENLLSDNQVNSYKKTLNGSIAIFKKDHWVYFHYSPDLKLYMQEWCSLTFEQR